MELHRRQKTYSEFDCPICYTILTEPVRLPCRHYFCFNCYKSMQGDQKSCPICRCHVNANFEPKIDQALQQTVKAKFPLRFKIQRTRIDLDKLCSHFSKKGPISDLNTNRSMSRVNERLQDYYHHVEGSQLSQASTRSGTMKSHKTASCEPDISTRATQSSHNFFSSHDRIDTSFERADFEEDIEMCTHQSSHNLSLPSSGLSSPRGVPNRASLPSNTLRKDVIQDVFDLNEGNNTSRKMKRQSSDPDLPINSQFQSSAVKKDSLARKVVMIGKPGDTFGKKKAKLFASGKTPAYINTSKRKLSSEDIFNQTRLTSPKRTPKTFKTGSLSFKSGLLHLRDDTTTTKQNTHHQHTFNLKSPKSERSLSNLSPVTETKKPKQTRTNTTTSIQSSKPLHKTGRNSMPGTPRSSQSGTIGSKLQQHQLLTASTKANNHKQSRHHHIDASLAKSSSTGNLHDVSSSTISSTISSGAISHRHGRKTGRSGAGGRGSAHSSERGSIERNGSSDRKQLIDQPVPVKNVNLFQHLLERPAKSIASRSTTGNCSPNVEFDITRTVAYKGHIYVRDSEDWERDSSRLHSPRRSVHFNLPDENGRPTAIHGMVCRPHVPDGETVQLRSSLKLHPAGGDHGDIRPIRSTLSVDKTLGAYERTLSDLENKLLSGHQEEDRPLDDQFVKTMSRLGNFNLNQ